MLIIFFCFKLLINLLLKITSVQRQFIVYNIMFYITGRVSIGCDQIQKYYILNQEAVNGFCQSAERLQCLPLIHKKFFVAMVWKPIILQHFCPRCTRMYSRGEPIIKAQHLHLSPLYTEPEILFSILFCKSLGDGWMMYGVPHKRPSSRCRVFMATIIFTQIKFCIGHDVIPFEKKLP